MIHIVTVGKKNSVGAYENILFKTFKSSGKASVFINEDMKARNTTKNSDEYQYNTKVFTLGKSK